MYHTPNMEKKMKLPVTFESAVTSSNRVTVPTWLSFVEEGDRIEGYVQLIDDDTSYPFDKKISTTRHITVGYIRTSLPDKKLPSRLRITIQRVHKTTSEGLSFNLVGYKEEGGNYLMNYSTAKPSSSVQFKLDTYTEELVEKYFLLPDKDISQFVEPIYAEAEKKWIIPIFVPIEDEMGSQIPVIIHFVLSQDNYHNYLETIEKISKLILRFSNWMYDVNDFNTETLSKLSSQFQEIIEKQIEPEYYEMKAVLQLPKHERELLLIALKEHRSGGIILKTLAHQVRDSEQNVQKTVNELVQRGVLRKFVEEGQTIVDTLWVA